MQKPITSYFNNRYKRPKFEDQDNQSEHLSIFSNVTIDIYENNLNPNSNDIDYIYKLKDNRLKCKKIFRII